jgi:CBS domain-containing protein
MIESPERTRVGLDELFVAEAMHPGLISCPLDAPLRTVARMMATYRVHAVLVTGHGEEELPGGGVWGVISDIDLARAAAAGDLDASARSVAVTPVLAVTGTDTLAHAAHLMVEHGISHLIVVEPRSARPMGVLSTLDVARAAAGFPERHPIAPLPLHLETW